MILIEIKDYRFKDNYLIMNIRHTEEIEIPMLQVNTENESGEIGIKIPLTQTKSFIFQKP